jgi:DNA-binding MarR family transcriptional regulator
MSQQALGEYIGKDRTTIVAIVDELEEEGLVERRRNPDDRRAYALQVTPRGHDWLTRAKPALVAAEDGLLDALDGEERATLMSLLQRVLFGPDARR